MRRIPDSPFFAPAALHNESARRARRTGGVKQVRPARLFFPALPAATPGRGRLKIQRHTAALI